MIKSFDARELQHLYWLADAIAVKPNDAQTLISITMGVAKRCPNFTEYLQQLRDDLQPRNENVGVRDVALAYQRSADNNTQKIGTILQNSLDRLWKKS